MTEIYEKVEQGRTKMEKVLDFIPGWKGYKERQMRRSADQLLRKTMADKLADQRRKIDAAQKELINHGRLDLVDDLGSAVTQLQTFADRVRFASYGYAGIFDAVKIKQEQLAQIYEFDAQLIDYVERLEEATGQLRSAIPSGEGVEEAIRTIQDIMSEANSTFDQREHLILES
jgi:hypothetical protein